MTDPTPITAPGVYDIDPEVYHRDPVAGGSLSSSGARKLLPPGCPALFRWERDNPPDPKPHFDIGHAAHKLVLGSGPPIVDTGRTDRRGNAWKDAEATCREQGAVPLLTPDYEMVHAMADAIRAHPFAGLLFDPSHGTPEATLVWRDEASGINCRCRLDWLPQPRPGMRLIIPDYKTCASADADSLSKAMAAHGYDMQDSWNRAGCRALDLADDDATFVFVCQEKAPPYLVHVVQLDHVAQRVGDMRNRVAINLFASCQRTDRWPGYADDVTQLPLPAWFERQWTDE